jgi:citrate lyase gamma subunit
MVLKVEIDLEDLTQDLFNDEEYSLTEGVISSIRNQVVVKIKETCSEQIQTQIRSIVEAKVGVLIRETFLEWFKTGKIKINSKDEVSLNDYLTYYFTQQTGYTYTTTAKSYVEDFAKKFAKGLRERYDVAFAAMIVRNLK